MNDATVGNSEIAIKIGNFITENKSFRRRFLRRLNNFNRLVNDIVKSNDLRSDTKINIFNKIYQDARQSANAIKFDNEGSNILSKTYPSYLLITYFKTVWDNVMPVLLMNKTYDRVWNDAPVGSDKKKSLKEFREADVYTDINAFLKKKVDELKKY